MLFSAQSLPSWWQGSASATPAVRSTELSPLQPWSSVFSRESGVLAVVTGRNSPKPLHSPATIAQVFTVTGAGTSMNPLQGNQSSSATDTALTPLHLTPLSNLLSSCLIMSLCYDGFARTSLTPGLYPVWCCLKSSPAKGHLIFFTKNRAANTRTEKFCCLDNTWPVAVWRFGFG